MRSPDGLVSRARRLWQRSPSQAGWGAALLIGPHLVLGTWLLVVPDHRAFTAAQVVTLAHVALALLTFPLGALWVAVHVRKMRASRSETPAASTASRILAGAAAVACLTGFVVLRGGDIATTAPIHAVCGVAVGVPLALHLWLGARRWAAVAALATLLVATAGSAVARRWLPPAPVEAEIPPFSFTTRDASLYEPAENCGECHVQDYEDWKRSTHARTLELKNVQEGLERAKGLLGENLAHVGALLADRDRPISQELVVGACGSCHAPAGFYGNAKESMLAPSGLVAEGTGCSFCHTLRQIRENRQGVMPSVEQHQLSSADIAALVARTPFYVSAPETVRRYLGQGSRSPLARRVSGWLIRWRPAVHARDYHSPVLDDSRACLPCHSLGMDVPNVPHMTYYGWEHSAFNTGDPKTEVACQDCHMVRQMTGQRVAEEARMVPWGPVRKGARSHLFLGGNVLAAQTFHDEALAREQHALNVGAVSVAVAGAERVDDVLRVKVRVHAERVGHTFPALETQLRYGWVELRALDASGNVVAVSPKPRDSQDFGCASPLIMASVDDPKPDNQRLVEPNGTRELVGRVTLPAGAQVTRIVADLHEFVDPTPIATTSFTPAAPL